jgi:hypothetical protein
MKGGTGRSKNPIRSPAASYSTSTTRNGLTMVPKPCDCRREVHGTHRPSVIRPMMVVMAKEIVPAATRFGCRMIGIEKLTKAEREFVTAIINRLDSGDIKSLGTELLADFIRALTPEVLQRGYRLGDVLCQGDGAQAFNEALR